MNPFTKFLAWIAKPKPTEEMKMPEDTVVGDVQFISAELTANDLAASLTAAPTDPVAAAPITQAAPTLMTGFVNESIFDKLKTILGALGHELPVFFDEAVALAKKAL
jgi:hypothetical protein